MNRKITRKLKLGNVYVGGDSRITVQSMTNTDTRDIEATTNQILAMERTGCDIVRCAVPDIQAADGLNRIIKRIHIPLIADVHFDYKIALKSIESGASAIRINPGNIGGLDRIKMVAKAAEVKGIPIRIGVNSGSLEKDILEKYGRTCPEALVESALKHVNILESLNFYDICISIKSSDVIQMIKSNRMISERVDYPLHIGVTEAGTLWRGTVKSCIGIGTLLSEGIGDTIRVSLTGDVLQEVRTGREILKTLGYVEDGVTFVSCPTCGRTQINLIKIAEEAEKRLSGCRKNIKVAIMGCIVNGPGEAKESDIGIAGGKGEGLIFRKGEVIKKVKEESLIEELMKEIEKI
jgi:(E)-4-hydroxy-3-methylbut-2-enyl-diphosphate synthase